MATQLSNKTPTDKLIRKIKTAQAKWAKGVVDIGKVWKDEAEYTRLANQMLNDLYDFDSQGDFILFKPTLASDHPVRVNRKQTASYFIGGSIKEDSNGFARTPWEEVSFDPDFFFTELVSGDLLVMGRCTFTSPERPNTLPPRDIAVADYTFGYRQANDGLRIFLHHSSLQVEKEKDEVCINVYNI